MSDRQSMAALGGGLVCSLTVHVLLFTLIGVEWSHADEGVEERSDRVSEAASAERQAMMEDSNPHAEEDIYKHEKLIERPEEQRAVETEERAEERHDQQVKLGNDRSDAEPIMVAWIGYEDFRKLIAPKSEVVQPAQQPFAQPVDAAPIEIFPTAARHEEKVLAYAPTEESVPEVEDNALPTAAVMKDDAVAHPGSESSKEAEIPASVDAQMENDLLAKGGSSPESEQSDNVWESTDEGTRGVDVPESWQETGELALAGSNSWAFKDSALNDTRVEGGVVSRTDSGSVAGTDDQADSAEVSMDSRPLSPGAATGGHEETDRPTSAPLSDSQSLASSLDGKSLEVQPGGVLVGEGLEIKTTVPRFSMVTRVSAAPRNPVVTLLFDPMTGRVIRVQFVETSGYADVDGPVQASLYQWRATGSKLAEQTKPFELRIKLILGDE
jgi:hypothetical protein